MWAVAGYDNDRRGSHAWNAGGAHGVGERAATTAAGMAPGKPIGFTATNCRLRQSGSEQPLV